jgi:hypothetical protein
MKATTVEVMMRGAVATPASAEIDTAIAAMNRLSRRVRGHRVLASGAAKEFRWSIRSIVVTDRSRRILPMG